MEQIANREAAGASKLRPSMKDLLLTNAWFNRKCAFEPGFRPPALIGTQRALKKRFLDRVKRSLRDVQHLGIASWGGTVTNRTWFDESDFDKALSKEDILEVVRLALAHLSRDRRTELAEALLKQLHDFYADRGEVVQVVRSLSPWAVQDALGIHH